MESKVRGNSGEGWERLGKLGERLKKYLTITCRPHHGPKIFYAENHNKPSIRYCGFGSV